MRAPRQNRVGGGNHPYRSVSVGRVERLEQWEGESSDTYWLIVMVEDLHTEFQLVKISVALLCVWVRRG